MGIINRILYYGVIVPISLLPFPLLYALSDLLCVLLYYVVGYRKKVVMENLKNSFPEKVELYRCSCRVETLWCTNGWITKP